eukprot:scaffold37447_cov16-Tisochrysis_lutea.AAC.3
MWVLPSALTRPLPVATSASRSRMMPDACPHALAAASTEGAGVSGPRDVRVLCPPSTACPTTHAAASAGLQGTGPRWTTAAKAWLPSRSQMLHGVRSSGDCLAEKR